jgi:hypothetical protein
MKSTYEADANLVLPICCRQQLVQAEAAHEAETTDSRNLTDEVNSMIRGTLNG